MSQTSQSSVRGSVQNYYGKRVKTSSDLMTNCCTMDKDTFTQEAKEARKLVHPEVLSKNYGCGAVYPEAVEGCKVLDLGSGAGLDCYVLSKLVGPKGHVTGIDMTKEQLEIARKYIEYHTEAFAYSEPNVDFREGFIEGLEEVGLQKETYDIIVSNCVINLSANKEAVFKEAYRVLKTGGEMYFSDVYSSKPVPESLRENKVLWGECLSGALHWKELVKLATDIGFAPPVLVSSTLYSYDHPELASMFGSQDCEGLQFCSATYRLLKVPWDMELNEDTLVEVKYKGTIGGHQPRVKFSCQATLEADSSVLMPSSVSTLLQNCSRLSPHFTISPVTTTSEEATPLTPPLADFVHIDPFEMSSKTMSLAPPTFQSCDETNDCCGNKSITQPKSCDQSSCSTDPQPPAKQTCCGSN